MHYLLSSADPASHYIDVEYRLTLPADQPDVTFQLPAWRPGRYELQHFAKNIQRFGVFDGQANPLPFRKLTKDRWLVQTDGITEVVVRYKYYSNVVNAGSSFVTNDPLTGPMLYVNFVNLCLYAEGHIDDECTVELAIPDDWLIACGLPQTGPKALRASDFYELVDSPLIASPDLQRIQYDVQGVSFNVWVQGNLVPDRDRVIRDFSRFSAVQLALYGEFPEQDYHFLTIILSTPYYHGVEHRNSTVLVLGPNDEGEGLYQDWLGVSSHELFHAWNIIRIRPTELLPYDFTRENYFATCFVAEGVTTYYGDLMLRRAGVFDDAGYLKELHVLLKRHFEVSGRAVQSLTESSRDLWLDGYERGVPDRKVSVYHKGAIVALMLDLHLRRKTGHNRSLDDVMRLMWQRFGKPFVGYTLADYYDITEEVAGESLDWYYETCIFGNAPLETLLNQYLAFVGLTITYDETGGILLHDTGDAAGQAQRALWLGGLIVAGLKSGA